MTDNGWTDDQEDGTEAWTPRALAAFLRCECETEEDAQTLVGCERDLVANVLLYVRDELPNVHLALAAAKLALNELRAEYDARAHLLEDVVSAARREVMSSPHATGTLRDAVNRLDTHAARVGRVP